jgi:hypothetical protein
VVDGKDDFKLEKEERQEEGLPSKWENMEHRETRD